MAIPENLKKGTMLRLEGQIYLVLDYWVARTAQRRGTLHVKLKDVQRGKVIDKTIDDRSNVEIADSQVRLLQYLYSDSGACHFMDPRSFEQFSLPRSLLEGRENFLVEDAEYKVLFLEDAPVLVELPPTMVFEVVETPPASGTTAGNTDKVAILRGGITARVPRFIQVGDRVKINTETLEYLGKE